MTDKKPALGAANVTLTLGDGDEYTLRPTPLAIKTLSANYDGLTGCLDRLRRMDINAFIAVATVGTGAKGQAAKDLEAAVCCTPMGEVIGPLVEYVAVLMNGGRPLNAESDDDKAVEGNS